MPRGNPIVNVIAATARKYGVDPTLAVATALNESNLNPRAVGDRGSSFGLYQLHRGGELPSGWGPGQAFTPGANANVALSTLAGYQRRGRYGSPGALAAASQRPADPAGYAAAVNRLLPRARSLLAGQTQMPLGRAVSPSRGFAPPMQSPRPGLNLGALRAAFNSVGLGNVGGLLASGLAPTPSPAQGRGGTSVPPQRFPGPPPVQPLPYKKGTPLPVETLPYKRGAPSINYLEHFAQPFGLTVTSTTGGRHAPHSFHYRRRAVDFGGAPDRMAALAKYALQHPRQFVEVIYTGPGSTGYSILRGRVVPNSSLGRSLFAEHTNHVHLAR